MTELAAILTIFSALCRANRVMMNLRDSDLSGSDLSGSNLRGSDLSYSNLSGSNLRYSDLRYSNLSDSDLRGSDLRGSDLRGSNLRGSDLRPGQIIYMKTCPWDILIQPESIRIGCEHHTPDEWWGFSDADINQMDGYALEWWRVWKPVVKAAWEALVRENEGKL